MLQQRVLDAFQTLGLQPTCEQSVAATAYKKLALVHHPDRNYGDPTANARFQDIGEAWSICQRHFEHPASSEVPEPGARGGFGGFNSGRTYAADDDVPLDEYEAAEFFRFMFEEMLFNRYSRARAQRFRSQRAGADGGGVHAFSGGFAESQMRQKSNAARQANEKAAFEKRVREFEREVAEEQAALNRRAREEAQTQARIVSAHAQAFSLAEEGKGTDMQNLIENYALDVNKPRKLNLKKDAKVASLKVPNFETILHSAAGACDVATVDWLLAKGANAAALDASLLTPFHIAILRGNTPVARHFLFLFRNTKSTDPRYQAFCDGCHPSKATKDKNGSTPLQLAIRSGNADVVDLLLKEATVHDVEKCWKILSQAERAGPMGDVLQTKNGFVPPSENEAEQNMSKKALRKMKEAEEAARANEEKARRLAEEEENRMRKVARREKAAREEAERQAKREAEENKLREEAEKECARLAREAAARQEVERRARLAAEAQAEKTRQEAAKEAQRKLKVKEKEVAAQQQAKVAAARQRELELAAAAKAEAEAALARREAEARQAERERARVQRAKQQAELVEWDRARRQAEAERQAEAHRQAEAAKQQEKRAQEEAAIRDRELKERLVQDENKRAQEQQEQDAAKARQEKMRKRAEQSARDKARHQRIKEEHAQAKALETAASPTPSTPTLKQLAADAPKARRTKAPPSEAPPPPPSFERHYEPSRQVLLSPPMTPEDFQSMPIPTDLFLYEPPVQPQPQIQTQPEPQIQTQTQTILTDSFPPTPASSSPSLRTRRGRGGGFPPSPALSNASSGFGGNGTRTTPCRFFNTRGCVRGAQCAFAHVPRPRGARTALALEEELARKNLELERMRAELAAARMGGAQS